MKVPMLDVKPQYEMLHKPLLKALEDVMVNQYFALCNGPAVRDLEKAVAEYCGCSEAVGVSSGTDALLVTLMALGIGAGDEVITTPFTFFATAGCIRRTGARPVFVDIEPDTFNVDPARIEAAVTDKTRAILPVHLYGQMAEMDAIMEIAQRRGLSVVEDAAQSIGATYKDRRACSIGTAGIVSFYPTKNLGAMGDAGMVLTGDAELAERIRIFRNHGQGGTYVHKWVGGNFRMDSMCAATLSVKLPHLDGWSDARGRHAALYDELFADAPAVTTPAIRECNRSVYNLYTIRVPKRDDLRAFLTENDIGCGVYYPLSLHQQECFADLGYSAGDCPESERASTEVLSLPVYPELTDDQIRHVAAKVTEFLNSSGG